MIWKERVTKSYKEPYTLRSLFRMHIIQAYFLSTEIITTVRDRALEGPSVFQDNPITQPDIQKPALNLFENSLQTPNASAIINIRIMVGETLRLSFWTKATKRDEWKARD